MEDKATETARLRTGSPLRTDRLLALIASHANGSRTQFADLIGVGTTHVSKWLNDAAAPGATKLLTIAQRTGVSVDWLLGFDVPADRSSRAAIGDFARRLHEALRIAAPPMADRSLLGNSSDLRDTAGWSERMIQQVVAGWWEQQRQLLSRQYGEALLSLADRLDEDSARVSDGRVGTLMRQQAHNHRLSSALLRAGEGRWRDFVGMMPGKLCCEVPGIPRVALRDHDASVVAYLQAPFLALGGQAGVGVTWRAETEDEAWYIDPDSLTATHQHGGRFLADVTITDRFGPMPATAEDGTGRQ